MVKGAAKQASLAAWLACPRRCASCRQSFPREALLRVVRTPSGVVHIDHNGRTPGRGAYLCGAASCRAKASKKGLGAALKAPIPPQVTAWFEASQPAGQTKMK